MHPVEPLGNRQRLPGRHSGVLGVAATIGQRADAVTDGERADAGAKGHNHPGNFQAGDRVHARFHRVFTGALQCIRAIDPGGVHADQHFTFGDVRDRHAFGLQDVGATGFGDFDAGHFVG